MNMKYLAVLLVFGVALAVAVAEEEDAAAVEVQETQRGSEPCETDCDCPRNNQYCSCFLGYWDCKCAFGTTATSGSICQKKVRECTKNKPTSCPKNCTTKKCMGK